MYIYYAISSKIRFVVENLCSIYLDSATKIIFGMACDLKRKQNQASPSYSKTPHFYQLRNSLCISIYLKLVVQNLNTVLKGKTHILKFRL